MKKSALLLAAAVSLLAAPSALTAKPKLTGEERLAKLLDGREPGRPTSCINQWDTREMQTIDKTALVYGTGRTIWVQRTLDPDQIDDDDIQVTKLWGSQLCRTDIVQLHDRSSRFYNGFLRLSDFVPYRRVD